MKSFLLIAITCTQVLVAAQEEVDFTSQPAYLKDVPNFHQKKRGAGDWVAKSALAVITTVAVFTAVDLATWSEARPAAYSVATMAGIGVFVLYH